MFPLLLQAAPASASQALSQVQTSLQSLTALFEGGLLPVMRSIGLAFATIMLVIYLIKTFWSYNTGESSSLPMPIGTAVFRFGMVLVLLTGGGTASEALLPNSQGQGGPGTLAPGQLAPGDNYTGLAWGIAGFGEGMLRAVEKGSLAALAQARQNWQVCVANPPIAASGGPGTTTQTQGSAANSTQTSLNQQTCSVYTGGQSATTQTPTTVTSANPSKQGLSWKGKIKQGFNNIMLGGINNVTGAFIDLIQMLLGPIVFVFMVIHQLIMIVLWVLGPITVGMMMYNTKYFQSWVEQYVQVSLWPLITQLMVGMIAFVRQNVSQSANNFNGTMISLAFTIAIFIGLLWVPKIASFSEGLAASAGGALVGAAVGAAKMAGGAALSAAGFAGGAALSAGVGAVTGNTYAFGSGGAAVQRASDSAFQSSRAQSYGAGMKQNYAQDKTGLVGRQFAAAQAKGYSGDANQWIGEQAASQASKDLSQRQTQRRNNIDNPLGPIGAGAQKVSNAMGYLAPASVWLPQKGEKSNPGGSEGSSGGNSGGNPDGGGSGGGKNGGGGGDNPPSSGGEGNPLRSGRGAGAVKPNQATNQTNGSTNSGQQTSTSSSNSEQSKQTSGEQSSTNSGQNQQANSSSTSAGQNQQANSSSTSTSTSQGAQSQQTGNEESSTTNSSEPSASSKNNKEEENSANRYGAFSVATATSANANDYSAQSATVEVQATPVSSSTPSGSTESGGNQSVSNNQPSTQASVSSVPANDYSAQTATVDVQATPVSSQSNRTTPQSNPSVSNNQPTTQPLLSPQNSQSSQTPPPNPKATGSSQQSSNNPPPPSSKKANGFNGRSPFKPKP